MHEKRKSNRLHEQFAVRQRAQDAKSVESTLAKDISTGGLRITTDMRVDVGSKLNIEVNVPRSPRPYYAQGEVVWLSKAKNGQEKKFDMGVKFLRIISKNDLEDF